MLHGCRRAGAGAAGAAPPLILSFLRGGIRHEVEAP